MNAPRVLFYVQHLLGIGHLRRASVLARAMRAAGLDVLLVSGGERVPTLDLSELTVEQLPPARASDETFKTIVDDQGRPIDEAWKMARRERLLAVFEDFRPRVVILELYPFGRRQMAFELDPLIAAARATRSRPWIMSSVRDVLVQKADSRKAIRAVEAARQAIDLVLVHGDPAVTRLTDTLPAAGAIAGRLCYTGYVVERPASPAASRGDEVLVSAGGGAVGERLLETAIRARPLTRLAAAPWRVLVGFNLGATRFEALARLAPSGVMVERARPDFVDLLARCRVSVSQAGYNTVMEILATDARAVVVPFAAAGETEQTFRAARLADEGRLDVVRESDLAPETLARAIDRAVTRPPPSGPAIRLDGAETTARIVGNATRMTPSEPPGSATNALGCIEGF